MARQLRCEFPGAWHHVMSRGFQRCVIFRDDKDKSHFLELLEEMTGRYGVVIHAYVLMPNHYHLLLETPLANASRALQWLNVSYSVWFNLVHKRSGALFQARYKSVLIEGEGEWALSCATYIHLNPVRVRALGLDKKGRALENAGYVPADGKEKSRLRLEALRGYAWSSYRAYAGHAKSPPWLTCSTLLARLSSEQPCRAYRGHLEERFNAFEAGDDIGDFSSEPVVGGDGFKARVRGLLKDGGSSASNALHWKRLVPFAAVVAAVEKLKNEEWDSFVNRHGDWGRDMALYTGRHHCGMTLKELGNRVGESPHAARQGILRFKDKLSKQPELRKLNGLLQQILQTNANA
jgi:REP element-mobilizing transposase RayT